MRYLVDTNILPRLLQRNDPHYPSIRQAARTLHSQGDELCCAPQNIVEFSNVSTRLAEARGGFDLTTDETDRRVRLLERLFTILPESEALYSECRRLVVAHSVSDVQAHDARIAALMNLHGVRHILTFNGGDFARYTGITSVSPEEISGE